MAVIGLAGTFLSEETLRCLGSNPDVQAIIVVQIGASIYLGFAILNWMARGSVIGGIYGRPVTLGNFLHFAVASITLIKVATTHQILGVAFGESLTKEVLRNSPRRQLHFGALSPSLDDRLWPSSVIRMPWGRMRSLNANRL